VSDGSSTRFTRRRVVIGGAAGVGVVATAGYGRFAVGDEFEEHVAGVLGISTAAAQVLLDGARETLGSERYRVHAAAFLAATTFPGEQVLPADVRERAVERFIGNMLFTQIDRLIALGLQTRLTGPCRGLLRVT
jgi:hypothetical protein